MKKMRQKIAVITGATSGIGAATARYFAHKDIVVILLGRSEERGKYVVEELQEKNKKAEFIKCDVCQKEDIVNAKSIVEKRYGKVDILFNNAGIFCTSTLEDIDDKMWHKTFDTNVTGVMQMTKSFVQLMKNDGGNIINNASIGGLEGYTSGTSQYMYATSKAAVIKFSKLCALNFAPKIRVNCICPGIVDTEIFTNRDFSRFDGTIPLGRLAQPEEIARVVYFLASSEAQYITGAVVPIDGGASLL